MVWRGGGFTRARGRLICHLSSIYLTPGRDIGGRCWLVHNFIRSVCGRSRLDDCGYIVTYTEEGFEKYFPLAIASAYACI